MLFVYRSDKGNGDIYYSELNNNGKWSILKEFPVINSQYRETHASLSPDGKTLYFTSDRPVDMVD